MTKSLDLGCGRRPQNPFGADELYGVDVCEYPDLDVKSCDLVVEPIPFPEMTFDYVSAFDFIEHIPRVVYLPRRRAPFIELMNEVYRVLKTGGHFLSFTPGYPAQEAFMDPTHVNFITIDTFPRYFGKDRLAAMYGFTGYFEVLKNQWHDWTSPPRIAKPGVPNPGNTHILTILRKVT